MHSQKSSKFSCIFKLDTPSNTMIKGTISEKNFEISSKYSNYINFFKLKLKKDSKLELHLRESNADYGYALTSEFDLIKNKFGVKNAAFWHYGYMKTVIQRNKTANGEYSGIKSHFSKTFENLTIAARVVFQDFKTEACVGCRYSFNGNYVQGSLDRNGEARSRIYLKASEQIGIAWTLLPELAVSIKIHI